MGLFIQFLHLSTFAQGFIHEKLAFAGGKAQPAHELFQRQRIEIFRESKTVTVAFKASNRFLECLLICFTQTHDLADRPHLSTQFILSPLKFFKGPAGEFNDHIFT